MKKKQMKKFLFCNFLLLILVGIYEYIYFFIDEGVMKSYVFSSAILFLMSLIVTYYRLNLRSVYNVKTKKLKTLYSQIIVVTVLLISLLMPYELFNLKEMGQPIFFLNVLIVYALIIIFDSEKK